VNFGISIMKKLADLAHEKYNRWAWNFGSIFMDVSRPL
jgi:hypothetical protein